MIFKGSWKALPTQQTRRPEPIADFPREMWLLHAKPGRGWGLSRMVDPDGGGCAFIMPISFCGNAEPRYQPTAVVDWEMRPDLRSYLKMLRNYGYGSAEMGQAPHLYWRWLMTTVFPPFILFSRNSIIYAPLRYLRNAASALGWVEENYGGENRRKIGSKSMVYG